MVRDYYKNTEVELSSSNDFDKDAHVLTIKKGELNEMISEYDKEISLSSFKPQRSLNELVWDGDTLKSEIRLRLLDIADDFIDTLNVDWAEPVDVILTGSLANYNWSEFSDFDLHVLMDFRDVDEKTGFVKEYFNGKKKEWNENHDNLKIYNFPVELYVQDVNEPHAASGVYSLYQNKWMTKPSPEKIKPIKIDKFFIKDKSLDIIEKIEHIINSVENETDKHKLEKLSNKIEVMIKRLRLMRKNGLQKSGEMNPDNIVYKVLRRLGFLDKIYDARNTCYDKINSID